MTELIKLCDLKINETQKVILTLIYKPKSTYQIAAKLNKSYSSITQNLGILTAMGYATRIKSISGKTLYQQNNKTVEM